jgi:hypothetical protein
MRTKLQVEKRSRDLAMFNLAIDSKLRGCDVVSLKVGRRTKRRSARRLLLRWTSIRSTRAMIASSGSAGSSSTTAAVYAVLSPGVPPRSSESRVSES